MGVCAMAYCWFVYDGVVRIQKCMWSDINEPSSCAIWVKVICPTATRTSASFWAAHVTHKQYIYTSIYQWNMYMELKCIAPHEVHSSAMYVCQRACGNKNVYDDAFYQPSSCVRVNVSKCLCICIYLVQMDIRPSYCVSERDLRLYLGNRAHTADVKFRQQLNAAAPRYM